MADKTYETKPATPAANQAKTPVAAAKLTADKMLCPIGACKSPNVLYTKKSADPEDPRAEIFTIGTCQKCGYVATYNSKGKLI